MVQHLSNGLSTRQKPSAVRCRYLAVVAYLSMPHEFLNGSDVYAVLQKMGGKAMPEGMDAAAMGYPRLHAGFGVDC